MREANFQETQEYSEEKMLGKNRLEKVREIVFYIHTNIVTKKWVEKTGETIFPETHE